MKPIILKSHEVIHLRDHGSVIAWRVVKPQPAMCVQSSAVKVSGSMAEWRRVEIDRYGSLDNAWLYGGPIHDRIKCPYGRTGEGRWVKETWAPNTGDSLTGKAYHKADGKVTVPLWKSPVTMPRWASRFTVTLDVGLKRIQEVAEEEAIASGIEPLFTEEEIKERPELAECRGQWSNYLWHGHHGKYGMGNVKSDRWKHQFSSYSSAVGSYSSLHESIHGQGSWDRNDYFWKIICTLKKP